MARVFLAGAVGAGASSAANSPMETLNSFAPRRCTKLAKVFSELNVRTVPREFPNTPWAAPMSTWSSNPAGFPAAKMRVTADVATNSRNWASCNWIAGRGSAIFDDVMYGEIRGTPFN